MGDEAAFLRSILQAPDDDLPRLIFADWLDERGDPRGEFIRLQCALARSPDDDPARAAVASRAEELLATHEAEWAAPFCDCLRSWRFRRGFVEEITADASQFFDEAVSHFRLTPIRHLKLTGAHHDHACALAESPLLARLESLTLEGGIGDNGTAVLAASPRATNLVSLELSHQGIEEAGVQALANSPHLARLQALDLSSNNLCYDKGYNGLAALAQSKYLTNLKSLNLHNNYVTDGGVAALARTTALMRLSRLTVSDNGLHDSAAVAIADSPSMASLTYLDLNASRIRDDGIQALASSPHLGNLAYLGISYNWRDLKRNPLSDTTIQVLTAPSALPSLQKLDLGNHQVSVEGLRALRSRYGEIQRGVLSRPSATVPTQHDTAVPPD